MGIILYKTGGNKENDLFAIGDILSAPTMRLKGLH